MYTSISYFGVRTDAEAIGRLSTSPLQKSLEGFPRDDAHTHTHLPASHFTNSKIRNTFVCICVYVNIYICTHRSPVWGDSRTPK